MKRYTVKEAAQILGVGTDAIRKRVQRDTIQHERIDGTVYVWLDEDEPRHDHGVTEALLESYKEQLETYRDQVEFLRRELERKDTIIMTIAQRIPELEPATNTSSDARESPVTASEEPSRGEAPEEPETAKTRPWWRRLFE